MAFQLISGRDIGVWGVFLGIPSIPSNLGGLEAGKQLGDSSRWQWDVLVRHQELDTRFHWLST